MDFRVLGPVRVAGAAGREVTAPMQRRLLALLLCRPGERISADELTGWLWPGRTAAAQSLHLLVHRLRGSLGEPDRIRADHGGYLLRVLPGELDLEQFDRLKQAGSAAIAGGQLADGIAQLRAAIGLWRGEPFAGFGDLPPCEAEAGRLGEARLSLLESLYAAQLESGTADDAVLELKTLTHQHPLRERLHALYMIGLARTGRQADALAAYRHAREQLVEELGLEPGPELRKLEATILAGGVPSLEPSGPSMPRLVPAQLPPGVASFEGRTDEVEQLDLAAGRSSPVVVISGAAGMGKTAVAVHWAHGRRATFPDGQLYVDLAGYSPSRTMSPAQALSGLLRALGVPDGDLPEECADKAAMLRSLLADRRMLLVLDNARDADQVRPMLPSGPSVTVVTSRDALRGLITSHDATPVRLGPLEPADCVRMLRQMIGARVDAEPAAVRELVRLCGGMPLALRIAAANASRTPTRSLGRLAGELRDQDRLAELSVEGDPRACVITALHPSYGALSGAAQLVFRRLGLFNGPEPTVEVAASLAGLDREPTLKALRNLENAHLIETRAEGRYWLHDLVRLYARRCADADDSPADLARAGARLVDYYREGVLAAGTRLWPGAMLGDPPPLTGLHRTAFADAEDAVSWLNAEHRNLITTICADDAHPSNWRLVLALRLYIDGADATDLLAISSSGLRAAVADGSTEGEVHMRREMTWAYFQSADYDQAYHQSDRALRAVADCDRPVLAGLVLQDRATIDRFSGRVDDAITCFTRARDLFREADYAHGLAQVVNELAGCYQDSGDLRAALEVVTEALDAAELNGEPATLTKVLNMAAEIHLENGTLTEAEEFCRRGFQLSAELRDTRYEAYQLMTLGRIVGERGESEQARIMLDSALDVFTRMSWSRAQAETENALARLALRDGHPAAGIAHARRAADIAARTEQSVVHARALSLLAELERLAVGQSVPRR